MRKSHKISLVVVAQVDARTGWPPFASSVRVPPVWQGSNCRDSWLSTVQADVPASYAASKRSVRAHSSWKWSPGARGQAASACETPAAVPSPVTRRNPGGGVREFAASAFGQLLQLRRRGRHSRGGLAEDP